MKKQLLLIIAILLPMLASAQTVKINGLWYELTSTETSYNANVIKAPDDILYSGHVVIPSVVEFQEVKYNVDEISASAFRNCSDLISITVSDGISYIRNDVFENCSSLTSITIPKSVISIGSEAFHNCSNLSSVTLSEGVTSLGSAVFQGCSSLTSIIIPKSVIFPIGGSAFEDCTSLSTVSILGSIPEIGKYAFADCTSLATINIPESITSIGNYAFINCSGINSIVLPEGVTSIGTQAFYKCTSLTSINIPEGVTYLGMSAFDGCSSLASIIIPGTVEYMGQKVFNHCSSLASVTISEGVTSISNYAFADCSSLTSFVIPQSVTEIAMHAFDGCSSLASITLPEGITQIEANTFYGCSNLVSVNIPESVTSINAYAFYECSSLTSIVLPKDLSTIGNCAFGICPNLANLHCYAELVPTTDEKAFYKSYPENCTLYVPANVAENYGSTIPWYYFGKIVPIGAAITAITIDQTSITLLEEEEFVLTIAIIPEDAEKNLISWFSSNPKVATVDASGKVKAIAPGIAIITAKVNDGSGVSASCEVTVNKLVLGKCDTPIVGYANGKIEINCATENVKFVTEVIPENEFAYQGESFDFRPTYTFNVHATKEYHEDSKVASIILCWIECVEDHENLDGPSTGIITFPSMPVLIQAVNGVITLTGLTEASEIVVYDTIGREIASATATNGMAIINTSFTAGNTAIVKIAERRVKVIMR